MRAPAMTSGSARQKKHYENVHEVYKDHYYDETSMSYRRKFIYDPALSGLDLNGLMVADLACGSGAGSLEVLRRFPRAQISGFDISEKAIADYRQTGLPAYSVDLTEPMRTTELQAQFDVAMIFGSLHHCVTRLETTLQNIAAMIKPGGKLIMMEPNLFFMRSVRRFWYRVDPSFDAPTEDGLSHRAIHGLVSNLFDVEMVTHLGGAGYFLILNSMIFRMPKHIKRKLAPPLMIFDELYNRINVPRLHPYFIARWRRREL